MQGIGVPKESKWRREGAIEPQATEEQIGMGVWYRSVPRERVTATSKFREQNGGGEREIGSECLDIFN